MAEFSDGRGAEWRGIQVSGRGLSGEVGDAPAASTRGGWSTGNLVTDNLRAHPSLEVVAELGLDRLELSGSGGRGSEGDAALVVDLGRPTPEVRRVVLIEEGGQ